MLSQIPPSGNIQYTHANSPLRSTPKSSSILQPSLSHHSTQSQPLPNLPHPYPQFLPQSTTPLQHPQTPQNHPSIPPTPAPSSPFPHPFSLNRAQSNTHPSHPLADDQFLFRGPFDPNSSTPHPTPRHGAIPSPTALAQSNSEDFPDDQLVERALLEDSFIEHGLLAVDKSVSILGEILNLSEGRDKLFKLLSAVLKLSKYALNNWFAPSDWTKDVLGRIKSCSTATSTTRLFLKLCTDWVFFRLAIRVYYQQRSGTLKVFTLARLLGMAGYFFFQWPVWFLQTGISKTINKDFWQKLSLRCYIVSVCSQIFMDLRKAIDLTKEIGYWQLIVPGEALEQLQEQRRQQVQVCQEHDCQVTAHCNGNQCASAGKQTRLGSLNPHSPTVTLPPGQHSPHSPTTSSSASPQLNNNSANHKPGSPTTPGLKNSTSLSHIPQQTLPSTGQNATASNSSTKATKPAAEEEINPTYALSFQRRCTPTTARYQALLNRTIFQHQLRAQVAAAEQQLPPPPPPIGLFQNMLQLPSTLAGLGPRSPIQPLSPFDQQYLNAQKQNSQHSPLSPYQQHPYILASNQQDAFNLQLKQLQEETRLALVRENVLQKDRNKLFVNFLKDGGDLFGALDGLFDLGYSDLTLGLVSLISATISLYRMWARYKQSVEKAMLEEAAEKVRKQREEEEEEQRGIEETRRLQEFAQQIQDFYQHQQYQAQLQQVSVEQLNTQGNADSTQEPHSNAPSVFLPPQYPTNASSFATANGVSTGQISVPQSDSIDTHQHTSQTSQPNSNNSLFFTSPNPATNQQSQSVSIQQREHEVVATQPIHLEDTSAAPSVIDDDDDDDDDDEHDQHDQTQQVIPQAEDVQPIQQQPQQQPASGQSQTHDTSVPEAIESQNATDDHDTHDSPSKVKTGQKPGSTKKKGKKH